MRMRLLAARLERGELVVARAMACDLTGHRASDLIPALIERVPAARVTHFHVGLAVPRRHVPLLVRVRDDGGLGRAFALHELSIHNGFILELNAVGDGHGFRRGRSRGNGLDVGRVVSVVLDVLPRFGSASLHGMRASSRFSTYAFEHVLCVSYTGSPLALLAIGVVVSG